MKIKGSVGKRYFTITEAIFHRKVHVFLNYSQDEYYEWEKKNGIHGDQGDFSHLIGFSSSLSTGEWIIVVKDYNWCIEDQSTLIHEIVHTIIKIWSHNNILVNDSTQEFFAWEIGRLWVDIAAKIHGLKKIKQRRIKK